MKSQYTRGMQQYPSTVEEAARILSRHVPDNNGQKHREKGNQDKDSKEKDKSDEEGAAFVQTDEIICCACGTKGHKSNECKLAEKIPREQWWDRTKKATVNVNTETPSSDSSVTVSLEDKLNNVLSASKMKQLKEKGYCGVQVNMYQSGKETLVKVVLLKRKHFLRRKLGERRTSSKQDVTPQDQWRNSSGQSCSHIALLWRSMV